jgi:glyoxylase-like metal-dependent hydrolase (beta-lactamase superfamily II)
MRRETSTEQVAAGVARLRDTCNVYVLGRGDEAVLVDFGSGAVLDRLDDLGIRRVTDLLVTHHHRDQVQGLARAAEAGIRIWVPPYERELIDGIDRRWQTRRLDNDYDLRQDRFSLLEQVPVAGIVTEYERRRYGHVEAYVLPTPGHTVGSVTYLVEIDGRRLAFSGDLVHGDGRVWSLAATQWSYGGIEGLAATFFSCGVLGGCEPDLLLPSHGEPVTDPEATLEQARRRLEELATMREDPWRLGDMQARPWAELTPHLLRNRTSVANSYALVSETGAALLIDFGYEVSTGLVPITERTARRPLLWSIEALKRDRGVGRVEAVIPTHYHDDHVAGLALLRDIERAEVWAPENVAPVLEDPRRYDLPCLWHEPIPVDRVLPFDQPLAWNEYELVVHPLPGHTLHAAAIAFEVDGKRVLAIGDQHTTGTSDGTPVVLNYQYRNRYRVGDFEQTAALYRRLRPDLLISGHWPAQHVTDAFLDRFEADSRRLEELHRELLPEDAGFGAEGFGARIEPYRSQLGVGETLVLEIAVRNPFDRAEPATVRLVVPGGWPEPEPQELELAPLGEGIVRFELPLDGVAPVSRARVAADLTVGETPFGQQAEALVELA